MRRAPRTLAGPASFRGVGVHSGAPATLRAWPAPAGHGRVFRVPGGLVPARVASVVRTDRCTTLGVGPASISTVEHVLSAAAALGLDNLLMEVDGPEIPIMDGSALPFLEGFRAAGLVEQEGLVAARTLPRAIFAASGDSLVLALPAGEASFEASIHFRHPLVGLQQFAFQPGSDDYAAAVAPARTFGFYEEVQALLARGLARGGDVSNALVLGGPEGFSSPPRFPDEPVRHKVLDLIGDLALLESPLVARVIAVRAGHALHVELARKILEEVPHAGLEGDPVPVASSIPVPAGGSGPGTR